MSWPLLFGLDGEPIGWTAGPSLWANIRLPEGHRDAYECWWIAL